MAIAGTNTDDNTALSGLADNDGDVLRRQMAASVTTAGSPRQQRHDRRRSRRRPARRRADGRRHADQQRLVRHRSECRKRHDDRHRRGQSRQQRLRLRRQQRQQRRRRDHRARRPGLVTNTNTLTFGNGVEAQFGGLDNSQTMNLPAFGVPTNLSVTGARPTAPSASMLRRDRRLRRIDRFRLR